MIRTQFTLRTVFFSLTWLAASCAAIRIGLTSPISGNEGLGGLFCLLGIAFFGAGIGVVFGSARLGAGLALLLAVVAVCLTLPFAIQ